MGEENSKEVVSEKTEDVVSARVEGAPQQAPEGMGVGPAMYGGEQMDSRELVAQLQPLVVYLYAVHPPQVVLHFAKMLLHSVASAQIDDKHAPPEVLRWFQDQANRCRSALSILDSIISVVPAGGQAQVMRVAPPGRRQGR